MERVANKYLKVLVTGASGFIGRKLCLMLAEMGYQVIALCRSTQHPYLIPHPNITFLKGDILDLPSLESAMEGCWQVYHTAAMAKMWCPDIRDFYNINVIGTRNVFQTALKAEVDKVVYTSTCGVWGPTVKYPTCENDPRVVGFPIHYERTKYLAELEVHTFVQHGLDIVTVNPSRVYGDGPITGSNTVSKMIKGYLNGSWRFVPGDGTAVANYAFLDDVVTGHLLAMRYGRSGERYILGGNDICFNVFFEVLAGITRIKRKLFKLPIFFIKAYSMIQLAKTKLFSLPPVFLPEFADRLRYNQKYNSQKAIDELGYQITPFKVGLNKTIDHLQKKTE